MASAIPNPFLSTDPKYTGPPMISCTYSGPTTYEQRLSTYPASWYKNNRCPDPAVMAQVELFRISSPDRIHLAGCSECDFGTAQWDKDPFVLHVKNSPNCPLILRARKEHQASQAIAQSSTSLVNQMSAQVAMQTASQVAPPAIIESISTPSIAELEAQAIIESCTQLATQRRSSSSTQEATSQIANQMTAFEDDRVVAYEQDLQVAIATPLPQAVECRRCLAEFSSNSKLHQHVRESHGKKTPQPATSKAMSVAEHSDTKSIVSLNCYVSTLASAESTSEATRASARSTRSTGSTKSMTAASASKSQLPLKCSASSLLTSETTSSAAPSRPVTPPPTYRAMSPSPPAYQPKKNYLTVANLYVQYAPLKSVLSATKGTRSATQKTTASRAYLTIQNLYERFSQKTRSSTFKWAPKSSANSKAFDVKRSYIAGQESSKSMGRNAGKAMPSVMKSPATSTAGRIKSSASKSACDSKSSPIDFFRDPKSNVKTRFVTIANPNAQRLVTQQQRQTRLPSSPPLELYPIAIDAAISLGPKCVVDDEYQMVLI